MLLVCVFFSFFFFFQSSHNFQGKKLEAEIPFLASRWQNPSEAAAAPGGAAETDLDASQVNGACYEICAVLETEESLRPLQPLTSQTDSGGEQSSAVLEGGGWGGNAHRLLRVTR